MVKIQRLAMLSSLLAVCLVVQPVTAAGGRMAWKSYTRQEKVEDETTVENGEMLRASTYEQTTVSAGNKAAQETMTLKYFPVTMYDYEERTINQATDRLDRDLTIREGIYFSNGSPAYTKRYEKVTSGYEEWNRWDKASGSNSNGQKFYTGLVEKSLDGNKNIVFTKPEGGIFDSNASVKKIYTNVEMPFLYENGFYVFDAAAHGVYFHRDAAQKSSGTAANNARLFFNVQRTQSNGAFYGDGSRNVWAPYNDGTSLSEATMNYHFGMQATIPFTMTANGRINAADDSSTAIKFSFSGDDDVWVFIDGKLVIDLGGIHNRLDAEIDFAKNTVTYSKSNSLSVSTGSYNDRGFSLTQTLFGGLLAQDRTSFSAVENHELTIFYLERGKGSSNCRISFNLPVNDYVTVTKDATRSLYEDEGGNLVESPLTAEEQAVVDRIDFVFNLYQGVPDKNGVMKYTALKNTNFYLLNSNGQVLSRPSTDEKGRFTLKNGQSARFITTQMDTEAQYYVTEEAADGFTEPEYQYGGTAADGFLYSTDAYTDASGQVIQGIKDQKYVSADDIPKYKVQDERNTSGKVTVLGSAEAVDSLSFLCLNYLNAKLPNPSVNPNDDRIVIDYGLPVEIDVLSNDVYRGDSIELLGVFGDGMEIDQETGRILSEAKEPVYGTAKIENGKVRYALEQQLTSVEILNYLVKVNSSADMERCVENKTSLWAVGKIYIIPATTIYYEEDFCNLITWKTGQWETIGKAETDFQEPGVVGTVDDSPYGSDVAYIRDSKDSNGSARYVNTAEGAAQFSYHFTGKETSFFARTTDSSGYMRVVVQDESGNTVHSSLRNTVYRVTGETLYNIPVFTYTAKEYGTYTVTVQIAKGSEIYGADFWLDGIRVVSPLNEADKNVEIARSAYALDAESNMTMATLREKLLTDVTGYDEEGNLIWSASDEEQKNFVLFTDSDGQMKKAADYESFGPKEEVYLYDGQKVSFGLSNWDINSQKIFLGIKAPSGTAAVRVNGSLLRLENTADCYYDISSYAMLKAEEGEGRNAFFEIQAEEESLISVTNIKVTGNSEFTIIDGKQEEK